MPTSFEAKVLLLSPIAGLIAAIAVCSVPIGATGFSVKPSQSVSNERTELEKLEKTSAIELSRTALDVA